MCHSVVSERLLTWRQNAVNQQVGRQVVVGQSYFLPLSRPRRRRRRCRRGSTRRCCSARSQSVEVERLPVVERVDVGRRDLGGISIDLKNCP